MAQLSEEKPVSLTGYEVENLISLLKEQIGRGEHWTGSYHYGINAIESDIKLLRKLEKARRENWGGLFL